MIKNLSLRGHLFTFALILYSIISNPYPAKISFPEITIGLLIIISIEYRYLFPIGQSIKYKRYENVSFFQLILFILLLFPTIITISSLKCSVIDYFRDFIPLLYLFIPFFYSSLIYSSFKWYLFLPWVISIMGVFLSSRYIYVVYTVQGLSAFLNLGSGSYGDNKLYLTYEPSTHFAAVFLLSSAITFLFKKKFLLASVVFILGLIPFLGNLLVAQRAPTFLTIICVFAYISVLFIRNNNKLLSLISVMFSAFVILVLIKYYYLFSSFLNIENFSIFSKLLEKQEKVGLNSKDSELLAIFDIVLSTPAKLLFGIGWGSGFKDPIVPSEELRYTHAGLSYHLLKGGIIGIISFMAYLFLIFKTFIKGFFVEKFIYSDYIMHKINVFLSVIPAVIIGLLFQPTYKTLNFGVVLLSLVLFYKEDSKSHSLN